MCVSQKQASRVHGLEVQPLTHWEHVLQCLVNRPAQAQSYNYLFSFLNSNTKLVRGQGPVRLEGEAIGTQHSLVNTQAPTTLDLPRLALLGHTPLCQNRPPLVKTQGSLEENRRFQ